MIAVILSFSDDPARLELRPRHRELLGELHAEGLLVAAGPFGDQSGALLLFASDDVAAVKSALARDPSDQEAAASKRATCAMLKLPLARCAP